MGYGIHVCSLTQSYDSYIEPLEFGEVVISAEFSTIPKLNSEQQKIGFGGLKYEDLNKSPIFGRGKLKMGFYWDTVFEFALTPSVEIKGAKPKDLYGFALSKELFKNDTLDLGVRIFNLSGYAVADVTCSADVVSQPLYTLVIRQDVSRLQKIELTWDTMV